MQTVPTVQDSVTNESHVNQEKISGGDAGSMEQALLVGQPPGTVIKCVTAQVIQTQQGPRIVLQGLQGAEFTPQQLAVVQQQVKQQLSKGNILLSLDLSLNLLLNDLFSHKYPYKNLT